MPHLTTRSGAVAALLITTSFVLGLAWLFSRGAEQGTRADWLAAISTLAALAAASVAAFFAAQALAHERQRDEREVAKEVAAWAEPIAFDDDGYLRCLDIRILNASSVPVSELKATAWLRLGGSSRTIDPVAFGRAHTPAVLPPDGEPLRLRIYTDRPVHRDEFHGVSRLYENRVDIDLRFRDHLGVPWQRCPPAALARLTEEEWQKKNGKDLPLVEPPAPVPGPPVGRLAALAAMAARAVLARVE